MSAFCPHCPCGFMLGHGSFREQFPPPLSGWLRRRTGTVRTVFPGTQIGTGTDGTVFQEPKSEPEPCHPLKPHWRLEEPSAPKIGTARTVLSANRNRTEANRDYPALFSKGEKPAKKTNIHSVHENKGFADHTPETIAKDETAVAIPVPPTHYKPHLINKLHLQMLPKFAPETKLQKNMTWTRQFPILYIFLFFRIFWFGRGFGGVFWDTFGTQRGFVLCTGHRNRKTGVCHAHKEVPCWRENLFSLSSLSLLRWPGDSQRELTRVNRLAEKKTPVSYRSSNSRESLQTCDLQIFLSGKCKVLIFLRIWSLDSHALYIFSADDSGGFLQNPREIAQIVSGQNAQSMRVKRSDPQKD